MNHWENELKDSWKRENKDKARFAALIICMVVMFSAVLPLSVGLMVEGYGMLALYSFLAIVLNAIVCLVLLND